MKKSTVHYLEAIAGIRFAFLEIANLLHSEREDCIDLFELARDVCTDPAINTSDFTVNDRDVVGPAVYLLKLLVRKYGFPCLKQVYEKFNWIIPEGLRETNQVCTTCSYCYEYNYIGVAIYINKSQGKLCYRKVSLFTYY